MGFCCGCTFIPGTPLTHEALKAHYNHTMETLLFWELMLRRKSDPSGTDTSKLSQARIDLINIIGELYPEAVPD